MLHSVLNVKCMWDANQGTSKCFNWLSFRLSSVGNKPQNIEL